MKLNAAKKVEVTAVAIKSSEASKENNSFFYFPNICRLINIVYLFIIAIGSLDADFTTPMCIKLAQMTPTIIYASETTACVSLF